MKYRRLGQTDVEVSEIGFGCGPTAGLMVYGTPDEQRDAVRRAYDLGITYFDTAPIYGDFVSEDNLGRALEAAGVRPVIATKVCLELPDLDDIPAAVRRSVEDSLRRLRVDDVAVIQLHNRVASARAARADLGVGALLTPDDVLGPVLDTLRALRQRRQNTRDRLLRMGRRARQRQSSAGQRRVRHGPGGLQHSQSNLRSDSTARLHRP